MDRNTAVASLFGVSVFWILFAAFMIVPEKIIPPQVARLMPPAIAAGLAGGLRGGERTDKLKTGILTGGVGFIPFLLLLALFLTGYWILGYVSGTAYELLVLLGELLVILVVPAGAVGGVAAVVGGMFRDRVTASE